MNGNVTAAGSLIYAGNFIYSWSGALQFIQTEEGRLVPEAAGMRAEYAAKDHLGNTRATFACAVPGVPQVMEYHHYYPFGMTLEALDFSTQSHPENKFLYNTKELQDDYGLQWYDYGARFYDPQLGRWHSVDPLAEKYYPTSLYAYCANNPILLVDPNGMEAANNNLEVRRMENLVNDSFDGYKDLEGNYQWFDDQHNDLIYQNDKFWTKVTDDKDVFDMANAGILNNMPTQNDPGSFEKPDVLTNFEMWLDAPSSCVGEAAIKIGANILYGMANSPYSLLIGKTLGGTELNSKEKTDAFIETAPGLISLGLTGTKSVIKVSENGLNGFNKIIKVAPELTTTQGLPSGMKWQTHAGQVFQWNKVSSQGLNTFNQGLKANSVINEFKKEGQK